MTPNQKPNPLARNAKIFKAAWQNAIEAEIRRELAPIAQKHADAMHREMSQKTLEVIGQIQARLLFHEAHDDDRGICTVQLLLPKELTTNPPDGGLI